jgi:ribosomal protein S8E
MKGRRRRRGGENRVRIGRKVAGNITDAEMEAEEELEMEKVEKQEDEERRLVEE